METHEYISKTGNTRKSFMFVHVSSHCCECVKIIFSSFCKTAYFGMPVTQKPADKGHTSPGKTFVEKKKVYHSSTTSTCRVSGHCRLKKLIFHVNTGWILQLQDPVVNSWP